jgi:uncharacterized protein YjeT (DUF2065 family)
MAGMAGLEQKDAATVARCERQHARIVAAGLVLVLCGLGYGAWALLRFDPRASAAQHASFDRPVSSLESLYDPYEVVMRHVRPATDTERLLLEGLRANMNFSIGIMMTLLRIFLGLVLVLDGLFLWTVAVERRRLLQIIARLRA